MRPTTHGAPRSGLKMKVGRITNDPLGTVDRCDSQSYPPALLFPRFISENLTAIVSDLGDSSR